MLIFIILLSLFTCYDSLASNPTTAFDYEGNILLHQTPFALDAVQDSFTLDIFKKIDYAFGKGSLNLPEQELNLIKKAYLYLVFLTKLEKSQTAQFRKSYATFYQQLQLNKDPSPYIPSKELLQSQAWNEVIVTAQDLMNSTAWQQFCKSIISGTYSYFFNALDIIHNIEQQTFNYTPHIETCYYNQDYTKLRTVNEITRIKILLEEISRIYFLQQCNEWSQLPSGTTNQPLKKSLTVEEAITLFRNSEFYQYSHNPHKLLGKNNKNNLSHADLLTPKQLTSPLKEQVYGFLLFKEIFMMFYGLINENSLQNILITTSKSNLTPNFFPYTINDFPLFNDLLATKSKIEQTHTKSIHPSAPTHLTETTHIPVAFSRTTSQSAKQLPANKDVKLQNIFDDIGHFFSHVGHDIEKGAEDTWNGVKAAGQGAWSSIKAAGEGMAGIGASVLGNVLDISYLKKHGSELEKSAVKNMQQATKDMQKEVDSFAKGVENGLVSPTAELTGDMAEIVTDDKHLGMSLQNVINQVSDSLINVGAQYNDLIIQEQGELATSSFKISAQFANLVASSALTIGTLGIKHNEFLQNATELINTTVSSITQSFTGLLHAGEPFMTSVMQGLGVIINSLTTLFIDISRDISFFATVAATGGVGLIAWEIAYHSSSNMRESLAKYRSHTTNTLNAHRQTINQVMGVAVAIGFTIATGGEGAAESEAIITASETASEAGAETAEETTVEDSAELDADTDDRTIVEDNPEQADPEITTTSETTDEVTEEQAENNATRNSVKRIASRGMHAFNLVMLGVFGGFNIIAGINADALNKQKEKEEGEQLRNLWSFINSSKLAAAQNEADYLEELQAKQQAEIGNRILSLSFLQNILYGSIDTITGELSQQLARTYISLLTPDNNNLLPANIGTNWGLQTPYLDLYPSQGFFSSTTGRPSFPYAQEVAQAPFVAQQGDKATKTLLTVKAAPSKLWFNQKAIGLDLMGPEGKKKSPTEKLEIDIDLQVLYTLNSEFYTGLYLGGQFYDYTSPAYLKELQNSNSTSLDSTNLAKMVVLFRESAQELLHIGVYEHEGRGWILKEPLPTSMQLNQHHTYHLNALLDQERLAFNLWVDNNTSNALSKKLSVTAVTNQRTYGIIASGIAIEWNQLTPQPTLKKNEQLRPSLQNISEKQREKLTKQKLSGLTKLTFGPINLQAISKQNILFGQYLYTTPDTDIQKINPKTSTDYVACATYENNTVTNIGAPPISIDQTIPNPNVIVSMISGNVYNQQGNIVSHVVKAWNHYKDQHGPFKATINQYIQTLQQTITAKLSKISFGSFNLDIVNQEALQQGRYLYTNNQTLGTDATDYLVMAEVNNSQLGSQIGMPPTSPNAQGILSLVTGNLYAKNTQITPGVKPKPLQEGYSELYAYESQIGNLQPKVIEAIKIAQSLHRKDSAQKAHPVKIINFSSQTSSSSDMASQQKPLVAKPAIIQLGSPSQGSLSLLQANAAGSVGLQLNNPVSKTLVKKSIPLAKS